MKNSILASVFVLTAFGMNAQKIKLVSGSNDFLKTMKSVRITYDYSDMGVGKFEDEKVYVREKKDEYNKKEAGRGDSWEESWYGSRERVYQPKFESLFTKYVESAGIEVSENGQYTLIVKTTFTEPGWNIGISKMPAAVSFEYIIVDQNEKEVARYSQLKVPGSQAMGMDYDTSTRISESYAKGGKMFGGMLAKTAKKMK